VKQDNVSSIIAPIPSSFFKSVAGSHLAIITCNPTGTFNNPRYINPQGKEATVLFDQLKILVKRLHEVFATFLSTSQGATGVVGVIKNVIIAKEVSYTIPNEMYLSFQVATVEANL
jgi:hypothetical protein